MASTPIRTLIVDDEPIARKVLREELTEIEDIEIVGEAAEGAEALKCIEELDPDLVFLELQMPGLSGFEVIANLDDANDPVAIVIVTAYDQYAIQAFDADAIDYLLKPVSTSRLQKSLERVRGTLKDKQRAALNARRLHDVAINHSPIGRSRKIVAKAGNEYHLLDHNQVLAFQAERELVWIITSKQRYLATQPLKQIHEKLRGLNFARIHRNALVNLDHVAKMAPLSSQRWLLTLNNAQEFTVSKRQARTVQRLLHW